MAGRKFNLFCFANRTTLYVLLNVLYEHNDTFYSGRASGSSLTAAFLLRHSGGYPRGPGGLVFTHVLSNHGGPTDEAHTEENPEKIRKEPREKTEE